MSEIKVMNDDEIRDFCIKKDLKIFELEQQLQQKEKEIQDLKQKNDYLNDLEASAVEYKELKAQLQQKENIIKEAREYIEMHTPSDIGICGNKTKRYYTLGEDSVDHILEILDGENNDK